MLSDSVAAAPLQVQCYQISAFLLRNVPKHSEEKEGYKRKYLPFFHLPLPQQGAPAVKRKSQMN